MQKSIDFDDGSDEFHVKDYKQSAINAYWERWLIFKKKRAKDFQTELRKHLPPYFDANVNKINEFSMRENVFDPPCPQEFLEHLLNGVILRNELGLYRSRYFFYKELQQLLIEFLKLFYFRMDTIIDIFQTNTKLSVSKEKYPRIVVKCSNCNFYVFIDIHCTYCENEFYCDESCKKIHWEKHRKNCVNCLIKLPKIIDPLRIEVHLSSTSFGEEIEIYNEHNMKFSKMMKGQILLAFLYKSLRKDRWFRNNNYLFEEKIDNSYIIIKRDKKNKRDNPDKNNNKENHEKKDFIYKLNPLHKEKYDEDEFRDLLKLSVLQELKLNFYKLGALLIDILCEQHSDFFKYIIIFSFP